MKCRFVYATAALVLALGEAATASAQDSAFKVTVSGDAQFEAHYVTQKRDDNVRNLDFRNRFRLAVNPEAKTSSGLVYGGYVRFTTENAKNATSGVLDYDRAYMYVGGAFGTVNLGSHTSFNDDNKVARPADYLIEDDAVYKSFSASTAPQWTNGTFNIDGLYDRAINVPDAATKIRYDSPIMSGARLSVSYTPRNDRQGWTFNRDAGGTSGSVQDIFEGAILYNNKDSVASFGGVGVSAVVDYQTGDYDRSGFKNVSAFTAGLNLSYAGVTVGGGYNNYGKSWLAESDPNKTDQYTYNFGAEYQTGPMAVGASYVYGEKDANPTGPGKMKLTSYELGALYTVAPGMRVGAEYARIETKNTFVGIKDLGNVFLVSTQVQF